MKKTSIPLHHFLVNGFFMMDKIENSDDFRFVETHRHSFYEVLWFTDAGKDESQYIDFEKFTVQPNQICILSPNQVHRMDVGTKKGYLMAFAPDFFHDIFELPTELLLKPYYFTEVIPITTAITMQKIVALMEEEFTSLRRGKLLAAYASAFFIHTSPLFGQKLNIHSDKMTTVLKLIEKYFREEKEVAFYAKKVSLSIRRLNEISVTDTGLTVKKLIIERLVTEAKRLIVAEKISFKEISYHLGFNDPAYFSRIFKQKTGVSPEHFRKHLSPETQK